MIREFTRTQGNQWCQIQNEVEMSDFGPRLSICGSSGTIVTRKAAKKMALQYWVNFFEDEPSEIVNMNYRFGKRFYNAEQAAKFVIATDGPLHGLDVFAEVDGEVYLTESSGQIREELIQFFPECEPYLKFHLNDMQPGCEHQRQNLRGWEVGEVCGECGYSYGSQWLYSELPESVIEWATSADLS